MLNVTQCKVCSLYSFEAHLQNIFLFWFEFAGLGYQETLLCDLIDVCVIGCGIEGEVDHGIETLSVFGEKR